MSDIPHTPRIGMAEDPYGFVHIGFGDTEDTVLKVGGHDGPGGWRDVEIAREWAASVALRLDWRPLWALAQVSMHNRMVIDNAGVIQDAVCALLGVESFVDALAILRSHRAIEEEFGDPDPEEGAPDG